MTERTITADEVTCPVCTTNIVQTYGMSGNLGHYTVYSSECINGHKFNWKREVMIFSWANESTEAPND